MPPDTGTPKILNVQPDYCTTILIADLAEGIFYGPTGRKSIFQQVKNRTTRPIIDGG